MATSMTTHLGGFFVMPSCMRLGQGHQRYEGLSLVGPSIRCFWIEHHAHSVHRDCVARVGAHNVNQSVRMLSLLVVNSFGSTCNSWYVCLYIAMPVIPYSMYLLHRICACTVCTVFIMACMYGCLFKFNGWGGVCGACTVSGSHNNCLWFPQQEANAWSRLVCVLVLRPNVLE